MSKFSADKPNYDANTSSSTFEKTVYHKLGHKDPKQRVLTVRISAAVVRDEKGAVVGAVGEDGKWCRFVKQHFGYKVRFGKDEKAKEVPMTFLCVEERDRENKITKRCPECDAIYAKKERVAAKEAELKAQGKTKEEIDASVHHTKAWLKEHNQDRKWNMPAKDSTGRWGFLTISHKCYKMLKGNATSPGLIDKLLAAKPRVDPLGVEKGVWIRFTRTGETFNDFTDTPSIEKELVEFNGDMLEKMKFDTLTESDFEAISKLPPLSSLGRVLTPEQIRMLVESGGDEATVRSVMNIPTESKKAAPTPSEDSFEGDVEPSDLQFPPVEPPPFDTVPTKAAPAEDDEEAALLAQMAALKAKKAAKATQTPKPALSEDDEMAAFLAKHR